jgi:hypothetical protein
MNGKGAENAYTPAACGQVGKSYSWFGPKQVVRRRLRLIHSSLPFSTGLERWTGPPVSSQH